jgi:RimJ/RimL family protein N-acetyltransferase
LELRTERLLLRLPRLDDVDAVAGFGDDSDLRRWVDDWQTYRAGKFLLELPDSSVIGRAGLNFFDVDTWERTAAPDAQPELGWHLAPQHRGRGYATEAARAVRAWFDADRLVSLIAPENTPSQRVAARLGARPTDTVSLPDGPHVIWLHPR